MSRFVNYSLILSHTPYNLKLPLHLSSPIIKNRRHNNYDHACQFILCGPANIVAVLKMEQCHHKEPIGKAGFLEDIKKKVQSDKERSENNGTYESFFGVDWQVPVVDGVHFREDYENDTPCQRGFLSRDREGTLRTLHMDCSSLHRCPDWSYQQ
ncbi:hypothetical protein IV203_001643 [Nitzschia inconspicua]|uniref:Uncharacterized protein n=1 Tax=Nitzschia inconspicua TaxID=303405 RepID=A0A9K3L8L8_9STRA|nr:hypothetical protein IV203_001643 [Nitzschia inconspicua]